MSLTMTTAAAAVQLPVAAPVARPAPATARFDWTATVLGAVFLGGVFLDGWAHTHGRVDETFLTPWHAVLYGGYLATALFLWASFVAGVRRGRTWRAALPDGYGLSLLGAALWLVGGPFDAAWHAVFGFEASVEALMSPAHVLLALGFALMTSGPLRAGLRRPPSSWRRDLPLLLSVTYVVSALTFFTQTAHPLANLWASAAGRRSADVTELGLVSFCLTSAILMAPVLLLLRHGRLPVGGLTIMIGLNSLAMGFLFDQGDYPRTLVAAWIAAGVAADLLRFALRPAPDRAGRFRGYAFVLPAVIAGAHFGGLALTTGIGWSPHLWLGTVVYCGLVGWLMSYLVLPPRLESAR
jgi:hypothetical protein